MNAIWIIQCIIKIFIGLMVQFFTLISLYLYIHILKLHWHIRHLPYHII